MAKVITHFPHSVGYEGDGRLRDGPWCNGGTFGGRYDGWRMQKPGAMGLLEPKEWCPNCITIWEKLYKKPWLRTCRCDHMYDGLPAGSENCWLHGTTEGLQWLVQQKDLRIELLRAEAKKCAAALDEAERRLLEEAGTDPTWALGV